MSRTIGQVVRQLREDQGLEIQQLAHRARLAPSAVSRIEAGERPNPGIETVAKLAKALGITPGKLVDLAYLERAEKLPDPPHVIVDRKLDLILSRLSPPLANDVAKRLNDRGAAREPTRSRPAQSR